MRLFGTRPNAAFSKHPRSSRARLARCILPALALSAVFSVGTLAVRRQAPCTGRAPSDARPPQTAAAPRAQPAGTKRPAAYDILLCGTDADGVRTDTIILAHLDCARHRAALLSLPRDTPIRAEGGGLQQLNAVDSRFNDRLTAGPAKTRIEELETTIYGTMKAGSLVRLSWRERLRSTM